jgi:acetyl esterase/lipase
MARLLFSERFREQHPEQVARHLRNLAAHPASARGLGLHLTATTYHDTRARLPRITAPTLVLHGGQDELTPVRNAHLLAELVPDATLEVLPQAGHGYLLEQPAEAHRRFTTWLAARTPVAPGAPLRGVAARAEPVTRHLGLQVGALRTARSLVAFRPPRAPGRSPGRRAG